MIEASRCPGCDRIASPPEDRCRACRAGTEPIELAPEGTVLTYTSLEDGWIALVELEGGARTWLPTRQEPTIGATVALDAIADPDRPGQP